MQVIFNSQMQLIIKLALHQYYLNLFTIEKITIFIFNKYKKSDF